MSMSEQFDVGYKGTTLKYHYIVILNIVIFILLYLFKTIIILTFFNWLTSMSDNFSPWLCP